MNIEDFRNLIEIQRIDDKLQELSKNLNEEHTRIDKINRQKTLQLSEKEKATEQLKNIKCDGNQLETKIFDIDKRLKRIDENLMAAKSEQQLTALKNEQLTLKAQLAELEDKGLTLLDQIDQLTNQIELASKFLTGVDTTIKMLSEEVLVNTADIKKQILICEERMMNLFSITDSQIQSTFKSLSKKYANEKKICFVENQCCTACQYQIPKIVQSTIIKGNVIEQCPGCSRILIPHSVKLH